MAATDPKAEDEHRRQVIGARRRNNIYGETSDYIMMAFLSIGGNGGIYSPPKSNLSPHEGAVPAIIYGRSDTTMYIIAVSPAAGQQFTEYLTTLAAVNCAIPAIAVPNDQLKRVKFYYLDGTRLRRFT